MRTAQAVHKAVRIVHRSGLWDLGIMVVAFLLYYLVRGLVEGRSVEAVERALRIIELEKKLGIFWEPQLQLLVLSSEWLVKVCNAIYVYAHFPLIAVVGIAIFLWRRPVYVRYRNAFLISGGIGLILFTFLPTAPPRLVPWTFGFVDTMALFSPVNYDMQPAAFVNQYAAMPSLHFGWNLLLGMAIWEATRLPPARALAVAMPVAMGISIVATANHFVLDLVAGAAVALVGLGLALAWEKGTRRLWHQWWPWRPLGRD